MGAGVSGLTAAYLLRRTSQVTLYEADPRLGGHAHTHTLPTSDGRTVGVDSGFIVHNRRTYPHLLRLFDELGVATQESEMSMSIRCDGCGLEYAGAKGLAGVFAQPRRAADPRFVGLLAQVRRFHRASSRLLDREARAAGAAPAAAPVTLGDFLHAGHFSPYFVRHFVVPLVSAVWSCSPEFVVDYPAAYLFTFLRHHGMLSFSGSPQWRTVVGGSNAYVERAAKELTAVRVATPVRSVRRTGAGVEVHDADGGAEAFDAAVIATHADQALGLLGSPTTAQRQVLGAFGYSRNATVLHTDTSVL
ncbi:MAG TPA: FAD-dependent oxidoreductase, partial [Micromonosporaceae bacterium]|nr:FAD-dependent oxidoreductase [Micromonosporaceae bacterium]